VKSTSQPGCTAADSRSPQPEPERRSRPTGRVAATLPLVLALACLGCGGGGAGAVRDVEPVPTEPLVLYSPVDRSALAYGLPATVQGVRLVRPPDAAIRADEQDIAADPRVKAILVQLGLGPNIISVEQMGDRDDRLPTVATSAIQLRGVPAGRFAEFIPMFYLLATSATRDMVNWMVPKPAREQRTIADRPVWFADWGDFEVAWYAWGDVLYVVLADSPQLMEAAMRQMPWPSQEETA
jgi:hypothetical protein